MMQRDGASFPKNEGGMCFGGGAANPSKWIPVAAKVVHMMAIVPTP